MKSRNQDYAAFMENSGFNLRKESISGRDSRNFYGGERIIYLFEVNREKKNKLEQLEKYRKYRDEYKDYIYSNSSFLPVASDNLIDCLRNSQKKKAPINILIICFWDHIAQVNHIYRQR